MGGKRGLSEGIYLRGIANEEEVVHTADTRASWTIISTRVYNRTGKAKRPVLDHSVNIVGAGVHLLEG